MIGQTQPAISRADMQAKLKSLIAAYQSGHILPEKIPYTVAEISRLTAELKTPSAPPNPDATHQTPVVNKLMQSAMGDIMKDEAMQQYAQMAGDRGIASMLRQPEPETENMAEGGSVKRFAAGGDIGDIYEKLANGEPLTAEETDLIRGRNKMESNVRYPWLGSTPDMRPITASQPQAPAAAPATTTPAQSLSRVQNDQQMSNVLRDKAGQVPSGAGTPAAQQQQPNVMAAPVQTAAPAQAPAEKTSSLADYAKEWKDIVGENAGIGALRDRLAERETRLAKDEERAPWMALLSAGLGTMAGTSPFAMANIGQGAQQGMQQYIHAQNKLEDARDKSYDIQARLEDAQRQEQLAAFKYGAESVKADKAQKETERLLDKKIAAEKEINQAKINADAGVNAAHAAYYKSAASGVGGGKSSDYETTLAEAKAIAAASPTDARVAPFMTGNNFDVMKFHAAWKAKEQTVSPDAQLKAISTMYSNAQTPEERALWGGRLNNMIGGVSSGARGTDFDYSKFNRKG